MFPTSQTASWACFTCRKHRSLHLNKPYSKDTVPCSQCQEPMFYIGYRLQVPRKDDRDAWERLWFQYISPGYGPKGVADVDDENLHFETCKAKRRSPPAEDDMSTGCERCDGVWKRMPDGEKARWRRHCERLWPGST